MTPSSPADSTTQLDLFTGIVVSIPALLVSGFLGFMHDWTIGWYLLLVASLPGVLRLSTLITRWLRHRGARPPRFDSEQPFWRYPVVMGALTLILYAAVYLALDYIIEG